MRFLLYLPLVLFLACAGEKSVENNPSNEDSLVDKPNSINEVASDLQLGSSRDSSVYIGPVYAFELSQEYYTPLYFNDSMAIDGDALRQSLDSVIFEETDEKRSRVKREVATKRFYLAGLDTIFIYDREGVRLYRARLDHIEYFDTSIEGEFIGVYKPIGKIQFRKDVSYCVSQGKRSLKELPNKLQTRSNEALSATLMHNFKINPNHLQSIKHFTLSDSITYSFISLRTGSSLVESKDGKSIEVMKRDDNIVLMDVLPVHFEVNNHPIFLAEFGLADSDAMWVSLLTYSDGVYKANVRNRVYFLK